MRWLPAKTATQEGRKGGVSGAFLPVRARSGRLFWKLFPEKGAVLMRQNGADGRWKCVCGKRGCPKGATERFHINNYNVKKHPILLKRFFAQKGKNIPKSCQKQEAKKKHQKVN